MPHRTTTDTRLLNNLTQQTQSYVKSLQNNISSSTLSSSALQAYASALSPREAQVLNLVAAQMQEADEALRAFYEKVDAWRNALTEVSEAEEEVRRVSRDRDILVTRLIKASKHTQKQPNASSFLPLPPDYSFGNHNISPSSSTQSHHSVNSLTSSNKKLHTAQLELQSCEVELALKEEELEKIRERVVIGGLAERCEALIEYAKVLTEVGRRGLSVVSKWEREGKSKAREDTYPVQSKPTTSTMNQKPLPRPHLHSSIASSSPYSHQHSHINGRGRHHTRREDGENENGVDNENDGPDNSELSYVSNSSIAPSQSASQIALMLAHPTPPEEEVQVFKTEDEDTRSPSPSPEHLQHRPSSRSNRDTSRERYESYDSAVVPPAHAISNEESYGHGFRDRDADASYREKMLRRRITEEDFSGLAAEAEGAHLPDAPKVHEETRRGENNHGRRQQFVEEDEVVGRRKDNDEREDGRESDTGSDSPDDMRVDEDVRVVENRPFVRASVPDNEERDKPRQDHDTRGITVPRFGSKKDKARVPEKKAQSDLGTISSPVRTVFPTKGGTLPSSLQRPLLGASGDGGRGERKRSRSFVGALAGLFHRDGKGERKGHGSGTGGREDIEEEITESPVDLDTSTLVLPSSMPSGKRGPFGMRRGDSEDTITAGGGGWKAKKNSWATRTERNLKRMGKEASSDEDEGGYRGRGGNETTRSAASMDIGSPTAGSTPTGAGVKRRRSRNANGQIAAGGSASRKDASLDIMSDTGVNYSPRTSQAPTYKVPRGKDHGFDKWGMWGSKDDTRTSTIEAIGADDLKNKNTTKEGGVSKQAHGTAGTSGKLTKGSKGPASQNPATANSAGKAPPAKGKETEARGEVTEPSADANRGLGIHFDESTQTAKNKVSDLKIRGAASRLSESGGDVSRSGSLKSSMSAPAAQSGSFGSKTKAMRKGSGLVSHIDSPQLLITSANANTSPRSGSATPTPATASKSYKRSSIPTPTSIPLTANATKQRGGHTYTHSNSLSHVTDASRDQPSLMSIVEGVTRANRESWNAHSESQAPSRIVTQTTATPAAPSSPSKPKSRLIEVRAPRPISQTDISAPLNVALKASKANADANITYRSPFLDLRGDIEERSITPPLRTSSRSQLRQLEYDAKSNDDALERRLGRSLSPSGQPLKSALKARTRTPSPVKYDPPNEADLKVESKVTKQKMSEHTEAAPECVNGRLHDSPGAEDSGSSVLNSDTEEFVDAREDVTVEGLDLTDEQPPTPPPRDVLINSALSNVTGGGRFNDQSGPSSSTSKPTASPPESTSSPTGGGGSGSTSTSRRKSVRMSLQPTFSPTPPALDREDSTEEERRYAPWASAPSASTLSKSSKSRSESIVKAQDYAPLRAANGHANSAGFEKEGSVRSHSRNGDVWEDSSEEDAEYSRAKKLLWNAAKKMDKSASKIRISKTSASNHR